MTPKDSSVGEPSLHRDTPDGSGDTSSSRRNLKRTHKLDRRPSFDCIALLLQGGGALGAYQAGVYEAMAEANCGLDWVAGISIGGINSAIITGNPPKDRVAKLRTFWGRLASSPMGLDVKVDAPPLRDLAGNISAASAAIFGVRGFYEPRLPAPWFYPPRTAAVTSIYDTKSLKTLLETIVDFDLVNSAHNEVRLSLGSVNVRTGKLTYFDTTTDVIRPEHVMASGALPAAFPAVEVDGEYYWDGGIVSNTPLEWLARNLPGGDMLAFQVDLWAAPGELPTSLPGVITRMKEIMNSSRTAYYSSFFTERNTVYASLARYLDQLPTELKSGEDAKYLMSVAKRHVHHLVNLVYRPDAGAEGASKEFEFSRQSMDYRWRAGYHDMVRALRHPEVTERAPDRDSGIFVFDMPAIGQRGS
jgi:NTE family protein